MEIEGKARNDGLAKRQTSTFLSFHDNENPAFAVDYVLSGFKPQHALAKAEGTIIHGTVNEGVGHR